VKIWTAAISKRLTLTLATAALLAGCAAGGATRGGLLRLPIGEAPRNSHEIDVALDTIVDTARAEAIAPEALGAALRDRRVVLVGEEHTNAEYHTVQLRVLELLKASGIPFVIGMEMFPARQQALLDRWTAGALSESTFLSESDWYRTWGYHWGFYRDILVFARDNGIRVVGLREVPESDDPHADAGSAASDVASADHRQLLRAFFGTDSPVHGGMSPEQFDALFASQVRRDAAMARHASEALDVAPEATMVVLAGTGHVLYGLGIARQLPERYRSAAATILPVPVDETTTTVRASVADFVWGVPESPFPAYPELGVLTVGTPRGLHVIYVEPDSPADLGGIETGDTLQSIGPVRLTDRPTLYEALLDARWGDVLSVALTRGDTTLELEIALRR
jgi:aminopeptidase N